jgi:hypothetical protein
VIEVDGKRVRAERPIYVVLHKPKNVVSTMSDREGRPSVKEYLRDAGGRVYPVGRLDFATSGSCSRRKTASSPMCCSTRVSRCRRPTSSR